MWVESSSVVSAHSVPVRVHGAVPKNSPRNHVLPTRITPLAMNRPSEEAISCSQVTVSAGRKSVQQGLGSSRLPTFSPQEKSYIKGTCDFLGISHFTTRYITQKNYPSGRSGSSYFTDRDLAELVDPQWPDPGSEWLYSVPWGFRRLLNFVKVTQVALS